MYLERIIYFEERKIFRKINTRFKLRNVSVKRNQKLQVETRNLSRSLMVRVRTYGLYSLKVAIASNNYQLSIQ